MRFLVDAQLPPALARYLSTRGHAAEHVYDIGMGAAPDREVWSYAASNGSVLVTKDDDFVTRRIIHDDGPAIVWIRVGNTTNQVLFEYMNRYISTIESLLKAGEHLVEVG